MVQDVGSGHPAHLGKLGITPTRAANLRKLADYLLTLPAEYPDFDMDSYVIGESSGDRAHVAVCGTAACAAGHGPNAGVPPLPDETWEVYTDRAFVDDAEPWSWCFSAMWVDVDNTAHGAAKRILWLLEKGVPDNANRQQWGRDPLCYLAEQASA